MTRNQLFTLAEDDPNLRIARGYYSTSVTRKGLFAEGNVTVRFWSDGKITRGDVSLDLARNMTVPEAAKALGLK